MGEAAVQLDFLDLLIATALVLVAGVLSLVVRADVERKLALGAIRTVVQLLLVGYVLGWVFEMDHPAILGIAILWMTAMAGRAALKRSSRFYAGAYWRAFFTLVLTGTLTTFAVTELVVGVEPWYRPQYVIPLLGMVLGNGLTGISLCLDRMLATLDEQRARVEMELSLGATRWEAARDPLSDSVKHGMIPILNSMAVVGIVSIPGMMTGQILQGADPVEAVKYQIVVMFMIAAATSMGCVGIAWLTYRRLFNARHQLCSEQIRKR